MQPDIQRLAELQHVDLRLAELRGKLDALPKRLVQVEGRVTAAKHDLAAAKEALISSIKDRKTFEMDVESWKDKARKYRNQSSEVKTNEAYKALQHEIEHAEQEVAQAEDRLLDRMVAGEEFDRHVKSAQQALAAIEKETQEERGTIQKEHHALLHEVAAKEAERKTAVAAVPESLLETYERVASHRHGIGLAAVRDEACTLCGVRVRPHVFQKLRNLDTQEIFQCETCTRILYYVEPPAPAPAPSDSKDDGHAAHQR